MASGAYVDSRGVPRSYGGVAALADLGSRLRLGIIGLLGPDSAAKAALMRRLVFLLTPGTAAVEPRVGGVPWAGARHGATTNQRRRCQQPGRRWSADCPASSSTPVPRPAGSGGARPFAG